MHDSAGITLITAALVFALAIGALVAGTGEILADEDGVAGNDITWEFVSATGLLEISGTGDMHNWTLSGRSPWDHLRSGITSVIIADGITFIGNFAFMSCFKLESVEIPGSVISIGTHAFYGCTLLESVEIPGSVISIGNLAFCGCTKLTSVEIPDSVISIGISVFSDCTSLESVEIPGSITSLGMSMFSGCIALESVNIPDSVIVIGEDAFGNCSALTSVNIPDKVTSIGDYAFSYCEALTSIKIPDKVTSIGKEAFRGCSLLTSITFEGEEPSFGPDAFELSTGPDLPTDVYRYDSTLNIDSYSAGRALTYRGIYRISYMDGSVVLQKQYLLPGDAPSPFEGPSEKEGHTFNGWSREAPDEMPAEDVIINSFWTVNQYTITFDSDGGSPVSAITKDYGSPIIAPANPTRDGYTFVRWDPAIPVAMPAEDITVTAVWTEAVPAPPGLGSDMLLYAGIAAAAVAALAITAVFIRRR